MDEFPDVLVALGSCFQATDGTADAAVVDAASQFAQLFQLEAATALPKVKRQVASPISVAIAEGSPLLAT